MKILVVNCGSSSLKYQLIDMENEEVLASGKCDRIGVKGIESPFIEYKRKDGKKLKKELDLPNHTVAFEEEIKKEKGNNIDDELFEYLASEK